MDRSKDSLGTYCISLQDMPKAFLTTTSMGGEVTLTLKRSYGIYKVWRNFFAMITERKAMNNTFTEWKIESAGHNPKGEELFTIKNTTGYQIVSTGSLISLSLPGHEPTGWIGWKFISTDAPSMSVAAFELSCRCSLISLSLFVYDAIRPIFSCYS